ncbi:phosphotransferase enzyme family protein [Croceicoccus sediminis]|uniref:phosphotransferase enzyme family protein n=1 Tax=Croceicoccus sediminis TaxID=2571150 RepID=UPI0011835769|nr:phosphotransferase [Croceicoccus sediminis]
MSADASTLALLDQEAHAALDQWPLALSRVKLVKHRENAVYSVHCDRGRRYAVRLHRRGYHSDEALETELAWMADLRRSGLPVPDVVVTGAGGNFCRPAGPDGEERQIDLIEWLPGQPIGCSERGLAATGEVAARQMHALGAIMARMHDHAQSWPGLSGARRHSWDAEGLAGTDPLWGRFWDLSHLSTDERDVLIAGRDRARAQLDAFGMAEDRFGLIHADLVPENVLADGDALSIIDFDDAGFGWHMFDMATALVFTVEQPRHDTIRQSLLTGYRTVRTLPAAHEAMLPLFLFLRATTYLGWMQTRPEMELPGEMVRQLVSRATRLCREYLGES